MELRVARRADIPALEALIRRSVEGLMASHLTPAQMEAALGTVLGVDPQLIDDGTYFMAEEAGALGPRRALRAPWREAQGGSRSASRFTRLVGAGGWSRRATLYGVPTGAPRALDPASEPARIRAFFVDPAAAGRGVGTLLLERSERAARAAGFRVIELMATPTGIAFYERRGYDTVTAAPIAIPDGSSMGGRVMRKVL